MATTITLGDLRDQIRQRSDMEQPGFISDSELNSYINSSYFELYDILVQIYGDNYYVQTPYSFSTTGLTQFYDLPTDFYKLLGVDLALSNTLDSYVTIKPFNFADRNRYSVPNFQSFYGVTNLRYRINANQLWLNPRLTPLADDADTLDGISGWYEYIIADCCIKCLAKEESDVSVFAMQKQALMKRIEEAAENRDAGMPATVADAQFGDCFDPIGSGAGTGSY